jgi:hypothetical protein
MEDASRFGTALREILTAEIPVQVKVLDNVKIEQFYKAIQEYDGRAQQPD